MIECVLEDGNDGLLNGIDCPRRRLQCLLFFNGSQNVADNLLLAIENVLEHVWLDNSRRVPLARNHASYQKAVVLHAASLQIQISPKVLLADRRSRLEIEEYAARARPNQAGMDAVGKIVERFLAPGFQKRPDLLKQEFMAGEFGELFFFLKNAPIFFRDAAQGTEVLWVNNFPQNAGVQKPGAVYVVDLTIEPFHKPE